MFDGNSIYLRLMEKEDCAFRTNWVNDEETRKTLMFDWPLSLSGTEKWFDMQDLDPKKRNFMIISKDSNLPIGITGLIDIDFRHLRGQFYITIGEKDYRGKRIPDESIPLVLNYGFNELGLNRIYLYTLNNNERARKVYERNGFIYEGKLRKHYFCVGEYQDLQVMSVLKDDFKI
jgi:diamine N-acetyltransferase